MDVGGENVPAGVVRFSATTNLEALPHSVGDGCSFSLSAVSGRLGNVRLGGDLPLPANYSAHQMSVTRVDEGGRVHTSSMITTRPPATPHSVPLFAPFNRTYVCLDPTGRFIRPELIDFSLRRSEVASNTGDVQASCSRSRGSSSSGQHLHVPVSTRSSRRTRTRGPLAGLRGDCASREAVANVKYMDLGDCNQVCHRCGSLFWYGERLKGHEYQQRSEYHYSTE